MREVKKIVLSGVAAAATILAGSAASAAVQTAIIDGITVIDYGRADPARPGLAQPGVGTGTAQIQTGQVDMFPPNPPEFSNPGWNPFGLSDTSHQWWNIEGGQVTINGSSDFLTLVWGSPNDDNPAATNTVSFYAGADGTGGLIGQVFASDLYSTFSGINNTQDPGYLLSFLAPKGYGSVVFTTGSSDFEFAVSSVPEPSTWAMLGIGFAGLALAGYKRSRRDRLAPALG
jgi:PEP-CTERM motif